ncbi:hypothetical protein SCHPADRAFT_1003013 [Schizopora paradoxa]|uniref:Uncharacterized protein n=1 Tax=Schizopora paradoxa TaxID=27342 RepID=A0A0H2RK76_9AGAM|nr:hypothetical protein SCHPADRAFT_1003013 [Schizopora paradoxa]
MSDEDIHGTAVTGGNPSGYANWTGMNSIPVQENCSDKERKILDLIKDECRSDKKTGYMPPYFVDFESFRQMWMIRKDQEDSPSRRNLEWATGKRGKIKSHDKQEHAIDEERPSSPQRHTTMSDSQTQPRTPSEKLEIYHLGKKKVDVAILGGILTAAPVSSMFPEELHVCVIPTTTHTIRIQAVPMRKSETSMEVYLGRVFKASHHIGKHMIRGSGSNKRAYTAFVSMEVHAVRNETIACIAPRLGWKDDVVVVRHANADLEDKNFVNITEEDTRLVLDSLVLMQPEEKESK